MAPVVEDTPTVPDSLLALLQEHLPYSISLLRRLQFARSFANGTRPSAHVLLAYHPASAGAKPAQFAAAYVDMAPRPQTAMWLYSSFEKSGRPAAADGSDDELVMALLRRARRLEDQDPASRAAQGGRLAKIGSLAEPVRQRILARGAQVDKTDAASPGIDYELCGKWLFRVAELPAPKGLPDGMVWDTAREEDCALVRSRTMVNRSTATLLTFPSVVVRLADGSAVAWAFLGYEGALNSLHVEEPYRGKGLAKTVACKIMQDHVKDFGNDGWGAADVYEGNMQSQGVCKSIGGVEKWQTSWAILNLETVGEPL